MCGGRSQFAGLLAAMLLGVFLLYFTATVKNVPVVALSAIIILVGLRLLQPRELMASLRTRRASGYISIVTTFSVLIAGLMIGILVSVALAIILVLHRLARPHETITRTPDDTENNSENRVSPAPRIAAPKITAMASNSE